MRLFSAALLSLGLAAPAAGASIQYGIITELKRKIETGDWNDRIRAVNQLGMMGHASVPVLSLALRDRDWQVRLTAVHWMGQYGRRSVPELRALASRERCPLVRMSAVHWLGNLGESSPSTDVDENPDMRHCMSFFWPMTAKRSEFRKKRARPMTLTAADEAGCQFIRYVRPGSIACPEGTEIRGIGPAPHSIKILKKGKRPRSGVALCCPPGVSQKQVLAGLPRPREVECRLLPMDCPHPWKEMEAPQERGKPMRYRRSRRMKQGDIRWTHCCRPVGGEAEDAAFAEGSDPARLPDAKYVPFFGEGEGESEPYIEEEERSPRQGDVKDMPERRIALKALEKLKRPEPGYSDSPPEPRRVAEELRLSELAALFSATEEDLPRPKGISGREAPEYSPAAELESPEATEARLVLAQPSLLEGGPQSLPRPEGISSRTPKALDVPLERFDPGREGARPTLGVPVPELGEAEGALPAPRGAGVRVETRLRPPAEIEADAGMLVVHDALPGLLKSVRHKDSRRRARAVEAIGNLGPKARPAIPALRKALRDKSPRVRSNAAIALGRLTRSSNDAVRDLKRALKDKHPDVRYSAAQALGRIGTPDARRAFAKHMQRETRRFLRSDAAR